jgi:hypothetical protein
MDEALLHLSPKVGKQQNFQQLMLMGERFVDG